METELIAIITFSSASIIFINLFFDPETSAKHRIEKFLCDNIVWKLGSECVLVRKEARSE